VTSFAVTGFAVTGFAVTGFAVTGYAIPESGAAELLAVHQNQIYLSFNFYNLAALLPPGPFPPVLSSNREAAVRKPGRDRVLHAGQHALLYVGIELPEPLSLTEVTEQMTPTGDFGASFIMPHASVILPGL
jgi:hypothetical protein